MQENQKMKLKLKSREVWDMDRLLSKHTSVIPKEDSDIRCPFHDDSSPSAHLYTHQDNNQMYCFSSQCSQVYFPADVLVQHGGWSWQKVSKEIPNQTKIKSRGSKRLSETDYTFFEMVEDRIKQDFDNTIDGIYSYLQERG